MGDDGEPAKLRAGRKHATTQAPFGRGYDTWLGLIGKLLADPEMRAVQKEFDLSAKGPRLSSGYGTENVPKAGVVIFYRAGKPGDSTGRIPARRSPRRSGGRFSPRPWSTT